MKPTTKEDEYREIWKRNGYCTVSNCKVSKITYLSLKEKCIWGLTALTAMDESLYQPFVLMCQAEGEGRGRLCTRKGNKLFSIVSSLVYICASIYIVNEEIKLYIFGIVITFIDYG